MPTVQNSLMTYSGQFFQLSTLIVLLISLPHITNYTSIFFCISFFYNCFQLTILIILLISLYHITNYTSIFFVFHFFIRNNCYFGSIQPAPNGVITYNKCFIFYYLHIHLISIDWHNRFYNWLNII